VAIGLLWVPAGAAADLWTPGPSSSTVHVAGVSAELANGQVLLAGGYGGHSAVNAVGELLSAAGSAFTTAGSMGHRRVYAAATLLHNGTVLVAGGDPNLTPGTGASATAEIWKPTGGGTFTATGQMHVPRQVFTLTTLPNGQALAVGGSPAVASGHGSPTAELYNPVTGKWTLTGSMPSGRLGHTATLLANCKVLIVGDAQQAVTYSYVTGTFTPAGSEGNFQRSYQTATPLANGKVLIAGGETVTQQALKTASLYNPSTGRFTPTANMMSTAHSQGFAARLSDGRVIVGGGFADPVHGTVTDNVDIYDPVTNQWSAAAPLLPNSFAYSVQAQTLHNGEVAVMGTGAGNGSEAYTPSGLGPPASPPAPNCSDLFSIVSAKPGSHGLITLRVGVPAAGSVKATATVPAQHGVSKPFGYGSTSRSATRSGVLTLTITPGSHAKTVLKSEGSLKVSLAVTFAQPHKSVLRRGSTVTARWS
jgi:Kelch motif/Galactose oxidase, central domain